MKNIEGSGDVGRSINRSGKQNEHIAKKISRRQKDKVRKMVQPKMDLKELPSMDARWGLLFEAAAKGMPMTQAAMYAMLPLSTVQTMVTVGREDFAKGRDTVAAAIAVRYDRAIADHVAACLGRIETASEKYWAAAAWMLERVYPDQFSQTSRQAIAYKDVSKDDKVVVNVSGAQFTKPPVVQLVTPAEQNAPQGEQHEQEVGDEAKADISAFDSFMAGKGLAS